MKDFQRSQLWKRMFAPRADDSFARERNRLCSAYEIFWDRGVTLAQRISSDLPELTLHDEEHLAALWDRADQLTSSDYPINPVEAFVFGGAVLLHDAGHAFAAYNGGVAELKKSVEYRDAVAAILRRNGESRPSEAELANPSDEVSHKALFTALRRLHAKQAEVLATRDFGGNFLIEDGELRQNLGQLIGRIAASHHWDRNSLQEKLPQIQGAPGFMPQEWSIHPIKLACLLRCADAIQIDQSRAPAFAYALHHPTGISRLHWDAQQLAQPLVQPDSSGGPLALLFTSNKDFTEDEADAWWVAFDLVRNANQELQGCYQLMKDLELPAFTVDRVVGAEGPAELAKHIHAAGWRPISAEVRVTTVEQIVRLFGGSLLYGWRDPTVPLRELIQNASDAIRARRIVIADPFYEGKVVVSLQPHGKDGNSWRLTVEDDGIGMSERVLTGALLEFGKSFWGSEEAQDEFPGLVSARLNQGGRYGIGFFSTLMIAQRIEVTSRRFDAGQDQVRKLSFREGLKLRPLVSTTVDTPLGQFSTRIELDISSEDAAAMQTAFRGQNNTSVTLKHMVAHLCPSLDCDVLVRDAGGHLELGHPKKWSEIDPLDWVRQINFADSQADKNVDTYLQKEAPFIEVIEGDDGLPSGRAAIAFGLLPTGIDAASKLAVVSRSIHQFSMAYVGSIEYEPGGPQRNKGLLCNPRKVSAWATAQGIRLAAANINDAEKYLAAINIADFAGDPAPVARIMINRKMISLGEVYDLLAKGAEVFAVLGSHTIRDRPSISSIHYQPTPGIGIGIAHDELDFVVTTMEAWEGGRAPDRVYHRIPTDEDSPPSSFLSCLASYVTVRGRTLRMVPVADVLFAKYTGEESRRERLSVGTELRGSAIKISLG